MIKTPSAKKMAKSYLYAKKQFLKNKRFLEKLKFIFSVIFFILSVITYGYFVNISSTKGYFIKVEREKLSEIKFKYEIVNIDVRKLESRIFEKLNLDNYTNLTGKIITINDVESVALR